MIICAYRLRQRVSRPLNYGLKIEAERKFIIGRRRVRLSGWLSANFQELAVMAYDLGRDAKVAGIEFEFLNLALEGFG